MSDDKVIKVLVVEDNEAHADLIRAAFEDDGRGFDVFFAACLKEARGQISKRPPDIVVTDINLPDGKGSELVASDSAVDRYPLIVMTSFGNERLAVESMKLGVMDYVVKSATTLAALPHICRRAYGEWQAKEEKRIAERKAANLAAAISRVGEAITIIDRDGVVTYVNAFFEELTGYKCDEVVGKDCRELNEAGIIENVEESMLEAIRHGHSWKATSQGRRKDGTRFEEEVVVTPIRDGEGVGGFVRVQRDVTEERLLERQYMQSQKMAAMGHFAQKVTHDFTNALSVILGNNELIRGSVAMMPELLEYTGNIKKSADKIVKLISQLLVFANPVPPQKEAIKLNTVLRGVDELLQKALAMNIEKRLITDPTCSRLNIDPGLIEQAIVHVAINAAEAMPDGGVLTIEVSAVPRVPFCENYEAVYVRDTGVGMSQEQQCRIFEPFYSTKPKESNAGLGLSTVFRIMDQHGGRVVVNSEPGKGTEVVLLLPKENSDDVAV